MFIKWNKTRYKIILIFLMFIFFSTLIFSGIQVEKYNRIIERNKFQVGSPYDDSNIYDTIEKFTKYRSDEFIKSKDFTDEIKLTKENNKHINEDNIKSIKEDIKRRKEYLNQNNNLGKEQLAEEIKTLDEEQKQRIEESNNQYNKTDEEYKQQLVQMDLNSKAIFESRIKNIKKFRYFILDNKNFDFETNSSYDRSDIMEKFFTHSKYAVRMYAENKASVTSKEYMNGKSVDSTSNKLQESKEWIKNKDLTLYLWVPNALWENTHSNKLRNDYLIVVIISAILFFLTSIFLYIKRNAIEKNYRVYNKIPIGLFLIGFSPLCYLYVLKSGIYYMGDVFWDYNIAYLNPSIFIGGAGVIGTILFTYVGFVRSKALKEIGEKSVLVKFIKEAKSLVQVRNILFKLTLILVLIILQTIFAFKRYFIFINRGTLLPLAFIIFDVALFLVLFKKLEYFNTILAETEKITSGDLSLVLKEEGKGNLSKLAHNINNMKVGLKNSLEKEMRSERMKSELITNVSHDLKTPLTSIINYVDLLKKESLTPAKANDYVEILDRKSQRLKNLVEDLFEASKATSGAMDLNLENIEITELIKQTLAEFEEKIASSTLDFKVDLGKEKMYVMGDGKRTHRVFENLVQNVLKYSMKDSRVYVDLIEDEETTQLIIKNMSCYEMNFNADEISERFKRGDISRSTEGSGLGLAIAKSIMELQGGELKIEIDGDLFKARAIFTK